MKRLLLALAPSIIFAATPYNWGAKLRLPDGQSSLKIIDSDNGVEQSTSVVVALPLLGAAYQKVTIWPVKYRSSKTEVNCVAPCELSMPLRYGTPKLRAEYFSANDSLLRVAEWIDIPQAVGSCEINYKMPLEIIGFAPYRRCVAVNVASGADVSGTIRLYALCHRCTYDKKARVRVNGSPWVQITKANITLLNWEASANYPSLDNSQNLKWFYINLPVGTVSTGANHVEWEYWQEKKEQSGYRILEFGLFRPNVSIASVAISGTNVTVNTSVAHNLTTGNDVRINQYNGKAWDVNGIKKNVTVVDADTFTFTLTDSQGSFDGTTSYSGPTVARALNDFDAFAEENPATWIAPPGSNAGSGATQFGANDLLAPDFPGQAIAASCADCHARDGRDLKYFNYSNWSNIVRSMFHGKSEQQAKDIAAYVRANASSAPGRPYIPPLTPAPCADSGSAYDWSGCASLRDILPFDYGMYKQLFGTTPDASDFSPTRTDINPRTMRIALQLPDWNDWLPRIHPKDSWNTTKNSAWPQRNWPTSGLKATYEGNISFYAAGGQCPGAGCQAWIAANNPSQQFDERWNTIGGSYISNWLVQNGQPACQGNPTDAICQQSIATEQNQWSVAIYSTGLWSMTKLWERVHELNVMGIGTTWFSTLGFNRVWPTRAPFGTSADLAKAIRGFTNPTIPGVYDGSRESEATNGVGWYHVQDILLPQRGKPNGYDSIQPLDMPYYYGKVKDMVSRAGARMPLLQASLVQHNFQRYELNYPGRAGIAESYYPPALDPMYMIEPGGHGETWRGLPEEDRVAARQSVLEAALTAYINILDGTSTNGATAAFTPTMWRSVFPQNSMPQEQAHMWGNGQYSDIPWAVAVRSRAFGISQTLRDRFADWGASVWSGPSTTLANGIDSSQTSIAFSATPSNWPTGNHQFLIGSERITCSSRSGNTVSGCTRGSDGSTAAAAAAGAPAQIRIRWERAKDAAACVLDQEGNTYLNSACQAVKP